MGDTTDLSFVTVCSLRHGSSVRRHRVRCRCGRLLGRCCAWQAGSSCAAAGALAGGAQSLTIVCDGCNSDFRRQMVPSKPYATSRFVGLILKTDLPFPNYGHVVLADPSPVLLYPISSTEVRVLVDVPMDPD